MVVVVSVLRCILGVVGWLCEGSIVNGEVCQVKSGVVSEVSLLLLLLFWMLEGEEGSLPAKMEVYRERNGGGVLDWCIHGGKLLS